MSYMSDSDLLLQEQWQLFLWTEHAKLCRTTLNVYNNVHVELIKTPIIVERSEKFLPLCLKSSADCGTAVYFCLYMATQ